MQKKNHIKFMKKRWLAGTLLAACFLCGCTKKEELIFLTEEAAEEDAGEAKGTGYDGAASVFEGEAAMSEGADSGSTSSSRQEKAAAEEQPNESAVLCVHVCGAVKAAGVYELPAGSRVYEAVQAAGGFSAEADQNYVNQAQVIADGVKLVIPTRGEAAAAEGFMAAQDGGKQDIDTQAQEKNRAALQIGIVGGESSEKESAQQTDAKININTASQEELCSIPGVGGTRAAAIAAYRDAHGSFEKPEDIMKVTGIKEGMYEKIKDSICVD